MRKLISCILASGMILTCQASVASPVYTTMEKVVVEEDILDNTISEPTPEMMEEMIKRVRPLIDVPEEYKEFNWDYYGSNNALRESSWYFSWTDGTTGEISIACDTEGRITGYNIYTYNKPRNAALPKVSPEELQPLAEDFIKKTAPYLEGMDLRIKEVSYPSVTYNQCYTYYFERYENDIPVPENMVAVSVNHITKTVESFSSNINTEVAFNAPEKLLSEDEAKAILCENQDMELSYRLRTEYDDDGNIVSRKAYLVYTPTTSYISVDAATGEVYTERFTWEAVKAPTANGAAGDMFFDAEAKEEAAESEDGSFRYQLSEEELEQLAILESLISKDEATKVILENEDLYIVDNAYLADARLTKRYDYARPLSGNDGKAEERYVWNLYFLEAGETYLGMNAVVDAKTGELISYNADLPYAYHYEEYEIEEPELKYTQEQVIEIASEFIKKLQPEKYEHIAFSYTNDYSVIKYIENEDGTTTPVYRANRLTFYRQNEGLEFTYNSFNVNVDRATGKITRYSYTWYDDVVFESPENVVSSKEALMSLYSYPGFGINYEINSDYTYIEGRYNSVDAKVYTRPVYSLYNPITTTIRAIDGKLVNYNGDEIIPEETFATYSDIEGHWAKETIERFAWIGHGPEGDKFNPNENISGEEFVNLCSAVRIYGNDADASKLDSLTRMQAVKLIIDYLGYGKVAKLENVFITDFADNAEFLAEDIGYAAIARGFGIIEGDGENFKPYNTLTRAEAYTIIANAIDLGVLDN